LGGGVVVVLQREARARIERIDMEWDGLIWKGKGMD
jgi:hypothetical protein